MKDRKVSPLVTASVAMALGGFFSGIFNIIRRAFHLFGFAREAAKLDTDYTDPSQWKNIAVSVYDLAVIFGLSSGVLAVLMIVTGSVGIIYALKHYFGRTPLKSAVFPIILGVICSLLGLVSAVSLILSRSVSFFMTVTIVIISLIVPILFTYNAAKFHRGLIMGESLIT